MEIQNFRVTPDVYASKGQRFANFIVDRIIFYLLFFGVSFAIGYIYFLVTEDIESVDEFASSLENVNPLLDRLITAVIFVVFYIFSEILLKGKTVGKFISKTKVVTEDGNSPTVTDYIKRNFCRLIPFNAFSFLGAQGRGWHDSISDTYVVDVEKFNAKINTTSEIDLIGIEDSN